jgi:multicomponent K+:H+ antiporter subunit G
MSDVTASEIVVSALVVLGAAFALLGSLGLARFPDFYMRLHGPSKATTLGIGCLLAAALVHFGVRGALSFHEVLFTLFVALTTPVSAQLLARAARHRGVRDLRGTDPQLREAERDARSASVEPRPPGGVQ